jgi:hypothetical protein
VMLLLLLFLGLDGVVGVCGDINSDDSAVDRLSNYGFDFDFLSFSFTSSSISRTSYFLLILLNRSFYCDEIPSFGKRRPFLICVAK